MIQGRIRAFFPMTCDERICKKKKKLHRIYDLRPQHVGSCHDRWLWVYLEFRILN